MNYVSVTVVLSYRNLSTFDSEFTAFSLEDTTELVATRNFINSLKSNNRYEIICCEYEVEPMEFTEPTDPRIVNTVH